MRIVSVAFVLASASGCGVFFGVPPDGFGFAEPPRARVVVDVTVVGADGVPAPLERDLGHPVSAGVIDGTPVVLSAEVVDEVYTGTLLVFVDPLRAAPPAVRVEEASDGQSFGIGTRHTAVFGDLDGDGDDDIVVVGGGSVVGLVGGPSGLSALAPARVLGPVDGGAAIGDIDGDGDVEALFADGGFDRQGLTVDIVNGSLVLDAHRLTHIVVAGEDHCIFSWHDVNGSLWALGGACGTDDDPTPSPMRAFAFSSDPRVFVSGSLRETNANGVFSVVAGRRVDGVDLFINAFFRNNSPARPPVNVALRRNGAAIDVEVRDSAVDIVADLDGRGPAIVDVFDEADDGILRTALLLDEGDVERVLVVVVREE